MLYSTHFLYLWYLFPLTNKLCGFFYWRLLLSEKLHNKHVKSCYNDCAISDKAYKIIVTVPKKSNPPSVGPFIQRFLVGRVTIMIIADMFNEKIIPGVETETNSAWRYSLLAVSCKNEHHLWRPNQGAGVLFPTRLQPVYISFCR